MKLQMLFGKKYLLDKKTNIVHDLLAVKSDKLYESKLVSECAKSIKKIKWRDRKYLTFIKFMELYGNGEINGCPNCLPGLDKNKQLK